MTSIIKASEETAIVHIPSNIGIGLLGFTFPIGSDYESPGEYGISHLMEHLKCKSFDDLLPKMHRLGIQYNAYTSSSQILFYFTGIEENLDQLSTILYDRITSGNFVWTEEAFDIEKKTVLQEYEDSFNEQTSGVLENVLRKHYKYFGPIGLRSDIEAFTYKQSLDFSKRFRTPNLICQVGSGILPIKSEQGIFPTVLPSPFGNYDVPLEVVPKEGKTIVGLIGKKPIRSCYKNQVDIVLNCLNDGIESPLHQEIRDLSGLSYYSASYLSTVAGDSIPIFFASTSTENTDKLVSVYKDFFSGDLSRHITPDRFEDCYSANRIGLKMCNLLPHSGAFSTVLSKSPYAGLEDFTYEKCLKVMSDNLTLDNFELFLY